MPLNDMNTGEGILWPQLCFRVKNSSFWNCFLVRPVLKSLKLLGDAPGPDWEVSILQDTYTFLYFFSHSLLTYLACQNSQVSLSPSDSSDGHQSLIILGQGHGSLPLSQSQKNPNHENVSEDVHLLPCPFPQKESQENPILAVDKQAST